MKIAINTRFLLKDQLEGIGRFTFETLRKIVQDHPEHQFLFLFDRPYAPEFIFADNVQPLVLFPPARHPVLFYWWFEYSVARALRQHQADIFISPDGFLSLRSKLKTLLVVHDIAYQHYPEQIPWLERRYYQHFMPRFVHHATRLATVSQYTKSDLIHHYQLHEDQIDVVYNGCNEHFQPIAPDEQTQIRKKYTDGEPYLLYVGSVHPRKNVARLIEAFDQFKQQHASPLRLIIAGRFAWQTSEVQKNYQQAKHQSDILFLNRYLHPQELSRLLAAAYALIYVSLFEGFGIPLIEAMNCDVPVITANTSSMPEVAGDAGLLVDPQSTNAIAAGIATLWHDNELRQRLIQNGQQQRQRFTWDKTAQKFWQSIQNTVNSEQ